MWLFAHICTMLGQTFFNSVVALNSGTIQA